MKRYFPLIAAVSLGAIAGGLAVKKLWLEKYRQQRMELECTEQERELLRVWLQAEQEGRACAATLADRGYQKVAILGMNWEGRLLADMLGDAAAYGVEWENFGAVHPHLTVYRLGEDPLPSADCLVICNLENLTEKTTLAKKEFRGEVITLMQLLEWTSGQHE